MTESESDPPDSKHSAVEGTDAPSSVKAGSPEEFGVSPYDLPTLDKLPVIRRLMAAEGPGLALDIGIGTGYTTYHVFGDRPTVCVDLHAPNLLYYRGKIADAAKGHPPMCVVAAATRLPFKGDSFKYVLCSEVLEHLDDDGAAAKEIARVLQPDGRAVVSVPYTGIGFTGFLELAGIKTVHDYPGPERHVRPGYDEASMSALMAGCGLKVESHAFYLRLFTKLLVDSASLGHIIYQRVFHRRKSWTWSEASEIEGSIAFKLYVLVFPLLQKVSRLDGLLRGRRGFGLVTALRKAPARLAGTQDPGVATTEPRLPP